MNKREDTYGLSVIVFRIVLYILFGIFILLFKGLQSGMKGDWGKAFAYLAIPGLIVLAFVFMAAISIIEQQASHLNRMNREAEFAQAKANPIQVYSWIETRDGLQTLPLDCSGYYLSYDESNVTLSEYRFTNNSSRILMIADSSTCTSYCTDCPIRNISGYYSSPTDCLKLNSSQYEGILDPGETSTFYCVTNYEGKTITPCLDLLAYPGFDGNEIGKICFQP